MVLQKFWFAAGKETLSVNKITYICDFSRCGLNTRLHTLVSKPCSEATNIGDRLSLLADCGYWYKIRIHVRDLRILQNIMNL